LDTAKLVTQLMRGRLVRGSASQLLSSIEAIGGDYGFWLKLPCTLLAAFTAAAWPIRGAWWEGVRARQKGRDAYEKRALSVARWRLLGC
jgi:hypothetical protein